ncbi:MAG: hypothetical protein M3Q33_15330 [Acidobacteriota bacterium]|nr:hypothetical protein [Acidobacteriota bacterium]
MSIKYYLILWLILVFAVLCRAQTAPVESFKNIADSKPLEPTRAILRAFDDFPLVAIGEMHGGNEQAIFFRTLIQHPEFPNKVKIIVLEALNSKYQNVVDDYIAGKKISLKTLRPAWRDLVSSALGPMDSPNLELLLATIRQVNQKLSPAKRIRVLAGDPPIDWSKIRNGEDFSPWLEQRDVHYARVVENEVLAKGQKALLIIGAVHLERSPFRGDDLSKALMLQILDKKNPGKTFVVLPHLGFSERNAELEAKMVNWKRPSLVILKGSWLGEVESAGLLEDVMIDKDGNPTPVAVPKTFLKEKADAYLYLGPINTLTMEQRNPLLFNDAVYFRELNRRFMLVNGHPLDKAELMKPRPKKYFDNWGGGSIIYNNPPAEKKP